jgi:hypothetical protein
MKQSISFQFSSVTREKRKEEKRAVGEQRHCGEIMTGHGKYLKNISGYRWCPISTPITDVQCSILLLATLTLSVNVTPDFHT